MWIDESNQRFYAYNRFGQHPERLIEWFDRHMGKSKVTSIVTGGAIARSGLEEIRRPLAGTDSWSPFNKTMT